MLSIQLCYQELDIEFEIILFVIGSNNEDWKYL